MNLQTPHSPQEGEEEEQGIQYLSLDLLLLFYCKDYL